MADRWAVVELLERGLPYREIHRQTGVSVTTIGRVARYLTVRKRRLPRRHRTAEAERMSSRGAHAPEDRGPEERPAHRCSLDLLSRCGLKYSRGKDQLMCYGENMPLDVLFVRDDDIPDLVQEDVCDLGLVGLNVVEEKRLALRERAAWRRLFETVQAARFRALQAVHRGAGRLRLPRSRHRSPASASPPPTRTSSGDFSPSAAFAAEVVVLSGSVEIAPRLGRADLICDLVSTGSTLAANHLRQVEVVLESQAVLIRTPVPIPAEKQDWTRRLLMRIDGVEQVKGSKYIMLHAPRSALAGDRQAPARQRGADGDSPRGPRRSGRRARGVPRERLLGNSRGAEGRRGELRAGAAGREDAGLTGREIRCAFSTGNP